MKAEKSLRSLQDADLLTGLHGLVARQHKLSAVLLAYIAEVDRRELYRQEACDSMFSYLTERLHLSEAAAYKRLRAARVARRFPQIFEMVEAGELHLKGIALLAPHLTEENHQELLRRAIHQPAREIEKLVAEVAPRADVPSRVRALPRTSRERSAGGCEPACQIKAAQSPPERARQTTISASANSLPNALRHPDENRRPALSPLSPRRYELRVTIDEDTHRDLKTLQDLLAHQIPSGDPAAIVGRALSLLLEKTLAKKAAITDKSRKPSASAASSSDTRSRHIPAEVRRTVWRRDRGQCAFRDGSGPRCSSTRLLEFHHVDNWARGAGHDPERIELRCRTHNLYQAEFDYGAGFMQAAKRGGRAGELLSDYLVSRGN